MSDYLFEHKTLIDMILYVEEKEKKKEKKLYLSQNNEMKNYR